MSGRNVVMAIVVVGALVVAGVLVAKHLAKDSSMGEGMEQLVHYACGDCKQAFSMTVSEFAQLRDSQGGYEVHVPCASCGSKRTARAQLCYSCEKPIPTTGHGELPKQCPHCNVSMDPTAGTP